MDLERRSYKECRIEGDGRRMTGYAIRFNVPSVDLGGFIEEIAPEAVDRALTEASDVRALANHDAAKILGRTRAGTLDLRKDRRGLQVTIEPDPQISYAADLLRSVQRGDISGMSFGFRTLADAWNFEGQMPLRTVTDMQLYEVSVVSFPAYPQTDISVAMRSLHEYEQAHGLRRLEFWRRWHKTQLAKWGIVGV